MKQYLLDIVNQLFHIDVKGNAENNGKRMLSAIVIICCLHKMIPNSIKDISKIPPDHISALLSLLVSNRMYIRKSVLTGSA